MGVNQAVREGRENMFSSGDCHLAEHDVSVLLLLLVERPELLSGHEDLPHVQLVVDPQHLHHVLLAQLLRVEEVGYRAYNDEEQLMMRSKCAVPHMKKKRVESGVLHHVQERK